MAVVSLNPVAHITEGIYRDKGDHSLTCFTVQDAEAIIEDAKAEHRQHDERSPWKGDWIKVASVPLAVMTDLRRKGIWQDKRRLAKWLDDRDNAAFRTRPGKIGKLIGDRA